MGRRNKALRRTPLQVAADDASRAVMRKVGTMLRAGRKRRRLTQLQASAKAGISRSEWSGLERGKQPATIPTMNRAAFAVGGSLDVFIRQTSAADQPRDAVHLKHQELIIRLGIGAAWRALPEEAIDREIRTSRWADVLLTRKGVGHDGDDYAFWDVWDWFDDVGGPVRDFARRINAVDRYATARMRGENAALPRVGGVFVVRATQRNRALVAEHRHFFGSRFPGSGRAWLAALTDPNAPMPTEPALIWVAVNGHRLFPSRLGDGAARTTSLP